MQDINSSIFYKARFAVEAAEPASTDLLWLVVLHIRSWITRKHNRNGETIVDPDLKRWSAFKNGGRLFDQGGQNRVYAESACFQDDLTCWACRFTEYQALDDGFAPRLWMTEIGYRQLDERTAELSYVVTFRDLPGFMGLCRPIPAANVPNVVRFLLRDPAVRCRIGDNALSLQSRCLTPEDTEAFRDFLMNPKRQVPVIFISALPTTGEKQLDQLLLDPDKLCACVGANALVYYAADASVTIPLPTAYRCVNGMVRTYQPDIDTDNPADSFRHRFFSAGFFEEHGEEAVLGIFRRAIAQDVHFYEDMFRLDDCREKIDAQRRTQEFAARLADKSLETDEAMELAMEESEQHEATKRKLNDYLQENERLRTELFEVKQLNAAMLQQSARIGAMERALEQVRLTRDYPRDPVAVVAYFERVFGDRLIFTDRAKKSLQECRTKPEILWGILYDMATQLHELLQLDPANAYKVFTEQTGWTCSRGEGSMTRNDPTLMRNYLETYRGHVINVEAHIKNGVKESDDRFIRVHFGWEPELDDRIIIAHCGRHLDNYTTQKVK